MLFTGSENVLAIHHNVRPSLGDVVIVEKFLFRYPLTHLMRYEIYSKGVHHKPLNFENIFDSHGIMPLWRSHPSVFR